MNNNMKDEWIDVEDNWEDLPLEDNGISSTESLARGALQGVSLGFADEIGGGIESLYDVASTDKTLSDIPDLYTKSRDEIREKNKQAELANPATYMTGNIAGTLPTVLIPGLNSVKAASLLAQGAIAGAGYSNADNVKDLAIDTSVGAGLNLAGGKLLESSGKGINKVYEYLKNKAGNGVQLGATKLGKAFANIPEDVTNRYLNNPNAVNSASPIDDIADDVLNSVIPNMKKKASQLSSESFQALSESKVMPKENIYLLLDNLQEDLRINGSLVGKSQKSAYEQLSNIGEALKKMPGDDIDEVSLKRLIQALDENIDWNNPSSNVNNKVLSKLRHEIDDGLKMHNSKYADTMIETADVTNATAFAEKVFKNRQDKESFNKFFKTVKNLGNKNEHSDEVRALAKINQWTGKDIGEDILNSQAKQSFSKADTNGSRKTLLGGIAGQAATSAVGGGIGYGASGSGEGALLGATIGFSLDRYSAPVFKKILDAGMLSKKGLSHIEPVLKNALNRGNQSLSATSFMLQKQYPEFRKFMDELKDDEKK